MRPLLAMLVGGLVLAAAPPPAKPAEPAPPAPKPAEAAPKKVNPQTVALIDGLNDGSTTADPGPDAADLFAYLNAAPPTDERFAWAQLHLGRSLRALGYTHAATVFFSRIATERTNPDVLPKALDELLALSSTAHDETLVDETVFGTMDVGFLPDNTRRYAHYQQGLTDLKAGRERWARSHFAQLSPGSDEEAKARYAALVTRLKNGRELDAKLLSGFEELANDESAPAEVRLEAQMAVARLRYEAKDYDGALKAYQAVRLPKLDPGRAALYLEEAWARYHQGDLEGAMGLLVTLDAPAFRDEFLPDKYLLRAAIYKERCHYLPAKRAARELNRRFGSTLAAIKERRDLAQDPRLRRAAALKGASKRSERFVETLEKEQGQLDRDESRLGVSLHRYLDELYGVALAEARRERDTRMKKTLEREANRLLDAAEQVRLLEYEVGLELYARLQKDGAQKAPPEELALSPDDVGYNFSGEYWNDELRDLKVSLKSRCPEVAP